MNIYFIKKNYVTSRRLSQSSLVYIHVGFLRNNKSERKDVVSHLINIDSRVLVFLYYPLFLSSFFLVYYSRTDIPSSCSEKYR